MGIVNMNDTGLGTVSQSSMFQEYLGLMFGKLVPARFTDIHGYTDDDFSTYTDIWDAATELYRICTVSYGAPGWLSVGKSNTMFTQELPNPVPFHVDWQTFYRLKAPFLFVTRITALIVSVQVTRCPLAFFSTPLTAPSTNKSTGQNLIPAFPITCLTVGTTLAATTTHQTDL